MKAQELDVDHAIGHAAEDDAFCRIDGVEVEPVAGAAAHVEREHTALDKAQFGLDRGRAECQRGQLELKELEAHGARQESLAPNIGGQRGLEGQIKKIERPPRNAWNQARVKHHAQRFRGADLAVAVVAHARDLAVGIARDGAGLDVVHVGRDRQRDRATHTGRGHTGDADAAEQASLELETKLGLFLATGAGDHLTVLVGGQGPVIDKKAVERIKGIAAGNRLLYAEGVKAEGQIHKGRHTADGADINADPRQRREGDRHRGQDLIEDELELQQRQLVGEQRGIAAAEDLGPVADVGQVGHELQATALGRSARTARGLRRDACNRLVKLGVAAGVAGRGPIAFDKAHIAGTQAINTAQRQACTKRQQRLDRLGHVQRKLHRIQERPINALQAQAGLGLSRQFVDGVYKAAQRVVAGQAQRLAWRVEQHAQVGHGRGQGIDHIAERRGHIGHRCGNGQQEVGHRRLHVQAQVLDGNLGELQRRIAQAPIPVDHQIAHQLGHAHGTERYPEPEVGVDVEVGRHCRLWARQQLVQRELASIVALDIQVQGAAQAAALVARLAGVGVAVDHLGLEEQQLAAALKGADSVRIGRVAVQVGRHIQAQLRHIGILTGVGAQEEALAGRQAEAKVVLPAGLQRKPAVHIQIKARQADVQRQVQAGTRNAPAQIHVKADRVDATGGQWQARLPGRHQVAVEAIEAGRHVIDRDQLVAVPIEQDVQAAEDIEQLLADQFDRLAFARELGPQVLQQTSTQPGDHSAGVGKSCTDKGQVRRHRTLEQVLHRTQAQVNAVKHIGRVVEQLHQGAAPSGSQIKVGQLDHQPIGRVGPRLTRQFVDQGRDTTRAQGGVGRDLQLADLDVLAKNLGRQRQCQIKAPHGLDDRLAIDPGQGQAGSLFGHRPI